MTQTATVTAVGRDGYADCLVEMQTACGHRCADCGGGCAGAREIRVRARNQAAARAGDTVTLATGTGSVLGAAALVYLLPLALLFLGYGLCALLRGGETACVLAAVAGLLLGCGLTALVNRVLRRDRPLEYVIIGKE